MTPPHKIRGKKRKTHFLLWWNTLSFPIQLICHDVTTSLTPPPPRNDHYSRLIVTRTSRMTFHLKKKAPAMWLSCRCFFPHVPQCSRLAWSARRWPGITSPPATWGSCLCAKETSSRSTARSGETRAGGRERPTDEWVQRLWRHHRDDDDGEGLKNHVEREQGGGFDLCRAGAGNYCSHTHTLRSHLEPKVVLQSDPRRTIFGSTKNPFLKEPIKVPQRTLKKWFFKAPFLVRQGTFQTMQGSLTLLLP